MSDKINLKTTDIICNNILTQIVEKGRKNIEDKKTIKKYLIPHTANVANLLTAKVSKQI